MEQYRAKLHPMSPFMEFMMKYKGLKFYTREKKLPVEKWEAFHMTERLKKADIVGKIVLI
jgi:hypothetical protein